MQEERASPLAIIPHRHPVLLIDHLECTNDESAEGVAKIGAGPWIADGALWEMGLVEGLAQTAAGLMGTRLQRNGHKPDRGMLAAIRNFEIHRSVLPGKEVRFHVKLVRIIGNLSRVEGRVVCESETIAHGELTFFVETTP